jgi:hypothetical protein
MFSTFSPKLFQAVDFIDCNATLSSVKARECQDGLSLRAALLWQHLHGSAPLQASPRHRAKSKRL